MVETIIHALDIITQGCDAQTRCVKTLFDAVQANLNLGRSSFRERTSSLINITA